MRIIRYRTESYSGLGERDAASVMAFETFELENSDILECLNDTILKNNRLSKKISTFLLEMEEKGFIESMSYEDTVDFYKEVLKEIETETGIKVNYVLWLADKDYVTDPSPECYGKYMTDENDYDIYEVGPVVLSDLGTDGTLYGYTNYPEPLDKEIYTDIVIEKINRNALNPDKQLSSIIDNAHTRYLKQNSKEKDICQIKEKTFIE